MCFDLLRLSPELLPFVAVLAEVDDQAEIFLEILSWNFMSQDFHVVSRELLLCYLYSKSGIKYD